MKDVLSFLIAIIFLAGCNLSTKQKIDETTCKNIEIQQIQDSINFDSVIDSYEYICLSNKNGYVLGEIEQLVIYENRIYISSDGVFCFDIEGNPIFKIADKGHKKSELAEVTSISIQDGVLYVYDEPKQVIHKYNSTTGNFIENIDAPIYASGIFKLKGNFVADNYSGYPCEYYKGNARFLICQDFSNGPLAEYFTEDAYKIHIKGQLTYNNSYVLLSDYYNNKLYKIDDYNCTLEYCINYKSSNKLSSSEINKLVSDGQTSMNNSKFQYGLSNVYENENHLVGKCNEGIYSYFLYCKKTNSVLAFKQYINSNYQLAPYDFCGCYNDYFISIFMPDEILCMRDLLGFGKVLPSSHPDSKKQKMLMSYDINDNPIIALYKFKKI